MCRAVREFVICAQNPQRLMVNSFIENTVYLKKPGFTHCSDVETDLIKKSQ